MPKLILSLDGNVLKDMPLTAEHVRIGRKPHNDIQIENLAVSGEHAALHRIEDAYYVEDLASTNGTLVNGVPIQKHFLKPGDVIEIGKHRLTYVTEGPAKPLAAAGADFEKTMIIRPGAKPAGDATIPPRPAAPMPPPQPAVAPAPAAAPAMGPLGMIEVMSGGNAGKTLELTKNLVTLGKPGVQVAVISRRPQGYFVAHVEGATTPTVNGEEIGTQTRPLVPGDQIEIAGILMRFSLRG